MAYHYKYAMVFNFLSAQTPSGGPLTFTDQAGQIAFIKGAGDTATKLPKMIDELPEKGNWEVNSHSITFYGSTAIVSILLQCPIK
ncbi:MAG: hypothetical protein ABSA18_05170 [Dehalococcoidia bacterium]|jgi:hypothetical protein